MRATSTSFESALDRLGEVAHAVTGRTVSAEVRGRFAQYANLVHLWNRTHNLTAFRSPAEIVHGLFEDSLLFLRLIPGHAVRIVDVGAGAGIPGVPLHLVEPRLAVVLIEARRKRVSFLKALKREIELDERVTVVEGRAEVVVDSNPSYVAIADVVVARGVGELAELMPVAQRYLRPGGVFIASGRPESLLGGENRSNWALVELPELHVRRAFAVRTA